MPIEMLEDIEDNSPEDNDGIPGEFYKDELAWRRERGDLAGGTQLVGDVIDKIDGSEELTSLELGIFRHFITTDALMWIGCHFEELGLVPRTLPPLTNARRVLGGL